MLGAHMSIAGGLHLAIERGDAMGCEAIQIFVHSSRTWQKKIFSDEDLALFKTTWKKAKKVRRIVAHNSYLLNLSTKKIRRLSNIDNHSTGTFDITPDGKNIVFDRLKENSDVVLIDLPRNK